MSKTDWATWLAGDQRARWDKGEPVRVEAYLKRHTGLREDTEALLDLVYNEIVLREEAGEAPQLGEYVQRFPALAGQLYLLFEVHQVIEGSAAEKFDPEATTDWTSRHEALGTASSPGAEKKLAFPPSVSLGKRIVRWVLGEARV
jgi:hypothetical protein